MQPKQFRPPARLPPRQTSSLQPASTPAHKVTVKRGDSLYLIFKRLGLPQGDLALMTASKPLKKKLARIAPGQEIEFHIDAESRLTRLVHRLDLLRSLHVSRDGNTFAFEEIVELPDVSVATATGVIDSSLFEAGQRAGLSDNLIMQMAEIFAWDVDFALDIRVGDRFALVFEEQFKGENKVGEGPIIAAEFTNRRAPDPRRPLRRCHRPFRLLLARWAEHAQGVPAHPRSISLVSARASTSNAATRSCTRSAHIVASITQLREAPR